MAKQLTMLDIIKELEAKGHQVSFRVRSDGGILITKMDGVKYLGATGNTLARRLIGTSISQARQVQLARINKTKKRRTKKQPLPDDVFKKLRKVQRVWRKSHKTIEGTISTSSIRYSLEKHGVVETLAKLDKAEKYALGYAYEENVRWLIERIQLDLLKSKEKDMQEVIDDLYMKMDNIKEEWINQIYSIVYEWEQGVIDDATATYRIREIIR